ncbi:branched-chain-amino-acid aminotransferase, cytosolic-like [Pollicipes pollicipes]|uniref:branched-chain-amino-acid aminotransferase, cytosolic-like n=1 Tax=Pollicipes pollicipes TaxID=41117 RepID=UPI00188598F7|nr:branched-chain-amino-acid aminotransferase, cytosolic-like [Pollicipes pollicipes]
MASVYIPAFRSARKILRIQHTCYCKSARYVSFNKTFKFEDMEMELATPDQLKPKPPVSSLVFGKHFTDHMLTIDWSAAEGWARPRITRIQPLPIHPAAKVLHYALELFEGMKAYRCEDGRIRLFRPDLNMERMNNTASRVVLPNFDGQELISCIKRLVAIDQEWVPHSTASSLYIRPTLIGTEPTLGVSASNNAILYVILGPVGPYFASGFKPVSLLADPSYIRAWRGGCGYAKMGANYAPTVMVQKVAEKEGLQQVMWLYGEDHQITEVGTMNIFCFLLNESGERELVTPPLDGIILPGVTRRSILDLARLWGEFAVSERRLTMAEFTRAAAEGRVLEMFGAGTACIVCPVERLRYLGQDIDVPTPEGEASLTHRFLAALSDIQYGRVAHPWSEPID